MSTTPIYSATGKHIFARPVNMAHHIGGGPGGHYDRIVLCKSLLGDKDWVNDPTGGGGDEDKAITLLEKKAFADLVGLIDLPDLLDILAHFPEVDQWKERNFDFKRMKAEWRAKCKPLPQKPTVTRLKHERTYPLPGDFVHLVEDTPGAANREYERIYKAQASTTESLVAAKERIAELEWQFEKANATIATLRQENMILRESRKTA